MRGNRFGRYIRTIQKLRARYEEPCGKICITKGNKATRYSILENMAAIKYLGCDPAKMGSAFSGLPAGVMSSIRVRRVSI